MYALNRGPRMHPLANVDRMLEEMLGQGARTEVVDGTAFGPALDITEDADGYEIRAELPGVPPAEVEVSVVEDVMTVRGEKKPEAAVKDARVHRRELRHGKFARTVHFPVAVDAEKVTAAHRNGVLTIRVPKAAKAKPRNVKIEFAD